MSAKKPYMMYSVELTSVSIYHIYFNSKVLSLSLPNRYFDFLNIFSNISIILSR